MGNRLGGQLGDVMKDDPYIYSEENMKYLRQSIDQVESGKGTIHELKACPLKCLLKSPSKCPSKDDNMRENDRTAQ